MIDWSKYPMLREAIECYLPEGASPEDLEDVDCLLADVRHDERERCKRVCWDYELPEWKRNDAHEPRADRHSDPTLVADDCAAAISRLTD